jgi:hypothetical protein
MRAQPPVIIAGAVEEYLRPITSAEIADPHWAAFRRIAEACGIAHEWPWDLAAWALMWAEPPVLVAWEKEKNTFHRI